RIKGRSSAKLFESFPDLKRHYWRRHFWARRYFCVTSEELTEEVIKKYLVHHFEPKGDDNFQNRRLNGSFDPYRTFSP
ncbi:MAG TPA: hypothetical protein ENI76_11130, partial [Ignavibacteria bacterium]|nr:hypothetical protein [Ignavibacteria bacterium]